MNFHLRMFKVADALTRISGSLWTTSRRIGDDRRVTLHTSIDLKILAFDSWREHFSFSLMDPEGEYVGLIHTENLLPHDERKDSAITKTIKISDKKADERIAKELWSRLASHAVEEWPKLKAKIHDMDQEYKDSYQTAKNARGILQVEGDPRHKRDFTRDWLDKNGQRVTGHISNGHMQLECDYLEASTGLNVLRLLTGREPEIVVSEALERCLEVNRNEEGLGDYVVQKILAEIGRVCKKHNLDWDLV